MILLKAKSWQLFLLLIIPLIASSLIENYWVGIIVDLGAYALIFGWFLLVGTNLNQHLPPNEKSSDTFFTVNCFYLIVGAFVLPILGESITGAGMPLYILSLSAYFAFSFFYVVYFTSKSFLAVQGRESNVYRAEIVFISFFVFIVGLWILQPRIRKIFRG